MECVKCGSSENGFYSNDKTCKMCRKDAISKRRLKLKNDPVWLEKERERGRKKYHRLNYKGKYKPSQEKKKDAIERYRNKYPEKINAKNCSSHIFKDGFEKHHWSYNSEHFKDVFFFLKADHNRSPGSEVYPHETMSLLYSSPFLLQGSVVVASLCSLHHARR